MAVRPATTAGFRPRRVTRRTHREADEEGEPFASAPRLAGGFLFKGKTVFATWPQNDTDPEEVLRRIVERFAKQGANDNYKLEWAVVSQELHAEAAPEVRMVGDQPANDLPPGLHLHAVFRCNKKIQLRRKVCEPGVRNPGWKPFDDLVDAERPGGFYKNVTRTVAAVVKYVIKDGKFFSHNIDPVAFVQAAAAKQSTKLTIVAEKVKHGADYMTLVAQHPDVMMMHGRKVEMFRKELTIRRKRAELKKKWCGVRPARGYEDAGNIAICKWLNENIRKPRHFRQKQLLLWGRPGTGKSHLWKETLSEALHCYKWQVMPNGDFQQKYRTGCYDLIVFDEWYPHHIKLSHMNAIADGQPVTVNIKGWDEDMDPNRACMATTNVNPYTEAYMRVPQYGKEAWLSRWHIVEVIGPIRIELIEEELDAEEHCLEEPRKRHKPMDPTFDAVDDTAIDSLESILSSSEL